MNQILTDDEIFKLQYELQYRDGGFHPIPFARAIEQAILNKLNEQEPVAEVVWYDPALSTTTDKAGKIIDASMSFIDTADLGTKLYLHPAPSVPEGYQIVPIEPTESMITAMQSSGWMLGNYKAMLSAARSE